MRNWKNSENKDWLKLSLEAAIQADLVTVDLDREVKVEGRSGALIRKARIIANGVEIWPYPDVSDME
jgi:hypothetical protein